MTSEAFDDFFPKVGGFFGGLAAIITFIAVMIAAVNSVGWVVGIALGWIPAGLASGLAFAFFRYLWWMVALAIALLVLKANGL